MAPPAPSTGASVCPIEKARDLFRRASEQYDRGEYEGALADFAACHRCRPQPALLFNIGQTQRKLRRYADAIDSLRAFLRDAPGTRGRADVEKLIAELEKLLAEEGRFREGDEHRRQLPPP